MPLHPLTNFEMQKFYQKKPKFNGVYSWNHLPKIKDRAYVPNLDEFKYMNSNNIIYFFFFLVEHIPKYIKKFIRNKSIITNIFRMQACNSIMCGYFCIGFIDFMLKGKSLQDYTNLFFPNEYEKNDNIILQYFW